MLGNRIKLLLCLFFAALFLLSMFSCEKLKRQIATQKIINEWVGKEIKFPADAQCCVLGKDTVPALCTDLFRKEYKVMLYVDSSGCSDCRLKLLQWKQLIGEADSLFQDRVGFVFFFQPKDMREMTYLFRRDEYDHPVFIDKNNAINGLNHFSQEMKYQCFLLDGSNKVLVIGNPTLNPQVWELYKEHIEKTTKNTMHHR
jgi:hypothetical protein